MEDCGRDSSTWFLKLTPAASGVVDSPSRTDGDHPAEDLPGSDRTETMKPSFRVHDSRSPSRRRGFRRRAAPKVAGGERLPVACRQQWPSAPDAIPIGPARRTEGGQGRPACLRMVLLATRDSDSRREAHLGPYLGRRGGLNPELRAVIEAWPGRHPTVRAGILAMVRGS